MEDSFDQPFLPPSGKKGACSIASSYNDSINVSQYCANEGRVISQQVGRRTDLNIIESPPLLARVDKTSVMQAAGYRLEPSFQKGTVYQNQCPADCNRAGKLKAQCLSFCHVYLRLSKGPNYL